MRLLTWNVQKPAAPRAARVQAWLDRLRPDVAVLTEATPWARPGAGGVYISAEHRVVAERLVHAAVKGLHVVGVHVPNRYTGRKAEFMAALHRVLAPLAGEPTAVLGDFNLAPARIDEQNPFMTRWEQEAFQAIFDLGFVDAWRRLHPEAREYTWFSHTGNGFRLDHILLSAPLAARLQAAGIAHAARGKGLSDHAPVWADV